MVLLIIIVIISYVVDLLPVVVFIAILKSERISIG